MISIYKMPFSVPTMLLMNRVRMVSSPYQKAQSLANVWYYRIYTYGLLGGVVVLNDNQTKLSTSS